MSETTPGSRKSTPLPDAIQNCCNVLLARCNVSICAPPERRAKEQEYVAQVIRADTSLRFAIGSFEDQAVKGPSHLQREALLLAEDVCEWWPSYASNLAAPLNTGQKAVAGFRLVRRAARLQKFLNAAAVPAAVHHGSGRIFDATGGASKAPTPNMSSDERRFAAAYESYLMAAREIDGRGVRHNAKSQRRDFQQKWEWIREHGVEVAGKPYKHPKSFGTWYDYARKGQTLCHQQRRLAG
jgi:hypothetical protein